MAAGNVHRALALLGRKEDVLHSADAYDVGPLHDIDQGGEGRARWWEDVLRKRPVMSDECWSRALGSEVVIWHGPHPSEHLFMLRACSKLRGATLREVVLPAPDRGGLAAFYGAVAYVEAKEVAAHWGALATIDDAEARAERWVQLRDYRDASIRLLEDGAIHLYPETTYDDALLKGCQLSQWTKTSRVIGNVLGRAAPVGDLFLAWRLRRMLEAGTLEGRGSGPFGMAEEVRLKR
jgi:hypothetical protein